MKTIPLHPDGVAFVDDEDYEELSKHYWERHRQGYARQYQQPIGTPRLLMHRMIMKPGPGEFIDHINGLKWDNRRSNLRLATAAQNAANRPLKPNKSGYKGVYWIGYSYQAATMRKGKRIALGRFKDPKDAARAYNAAALEAFGEFAVLNKL